MSLPTALPDDALPNTVAERCRTAVRTFAEGCRRGAALRPDASAEELAGAVRALARETFADLKRRLTPPEVVPDPETPIRPGGSPTHTGAGTGEYTPDAGAAEPAPPPAAGRTPTVPGYAIDDTLGRGGMG